MIRCDSFGCNNTDGFCLKSIGRNICWSCFRKLKEELKEKGG